MMKQQEEQADTVPQASELEEDFRYLRVGYIDQGRKSDQLVAAFWGAIPGDGVLPLRWHYRSHESFLKRHGNLGNILWAASANSHLLLINGFHVLRVWHDTSDGCYVDIADNLYGNLPAQLINRIESIPDKNWKKSKPFTKRVRISSLWEVQELQRAVKRTYGLHLSTV